jgi:hypothetical protein
MMEQAKELSLEEQVEFLRKYCLQQSETIFSMAEREAKYAKTINKLMMKLFELSKKYNEPLFKDEENAS